MHRWRTTIPLCLIALAGCSSEPREVQVADAWVRLPAAQQRPGAGYFSMTGGSTPRRLVSVTSPQASRIDLHETGSEGGRMTMRPVDGVSVDPGTTIEFKPQGLHLMLFGIAPEVGPGDRIPVMFRFEKGPMVATEARVIAAGDDPP